MNSVPYLHLNCIKTDPKLKDVLPQEFAYRYHALPIATDGSRITIAMAYPEDKAASTAVASAVEGSICFVQADSCEIDQMLGELWPQTPSPRLRLISWTATTGVDTLFQRYSKEFADKINADLIHCETPGKDFSSLNNLLQNAGEYQPDLIIIQIPKPPPRRQFVIDFTLTKLIDQLDSSILVVNNQRWSFQNLLLGIRDSEVSYDTPVNWALRLAKNKDTKVTILPLLPPIPLMYGSFIHHSPRALLTSNDPFGNKIRSIAKRLSTEDVQSRFKIREGTALEQIHSEIKENNIDLLIMEAEPKNNMWRWLIGEIVGNLYSWFDQTLLITQTN